MNATTEGVVRAPSKFLMMQEVLSSMTEVQGLVVPRSIPIRHQVCMLEDIRHSCLSGRWLSNSEHGGVKKGKEVTSQYVNIANKPIIR